MNDTRAFNICAGREPEDVDVHSRATVGYKMEPTRTLWWWKTP